MIILVLFLISLGLTWAIASAAGFALWLAVILFFGIYILVTVLCVLLCLASSLLADTSKPVEKAEPLCRLAINVAFYMVCFYMGMRIRVSGAEKLPKDTRFLLVSNHRSSFDPIVYMSVLRRYEISYIAKPSVMALPFIGKIAHAVGCLGIDRENDRNALKTILTAVSYIKKDVCSVGIFPEGTRSRTDEMLPFHAGSFKIAQKAGCPLVIASIKGTESIKKNVLRRFTPVEIEIIEVMSPEEVKATGTQELADHSRSLIAESLAKN